METINPGLASPDPPLSERHGLRDVWRALKADVGQYLGYSAAFMEHRVSTLRVIGTLLTPSLMFVALYRLAHWSWVRDWRRTAEALTVFNQLLHKGYIAPSCTIGPGLYVAHPCGTVFDADAGRNLTLYPFCSITRMSFIDPAGNRDAPRPRLGDDVSLSLFVNTNGSVSIGSGCRIGPNLSISRDIPSNSLVLVRDRIIVKPPEQQEPGPRIPNVADDDSATFQVRPQEVPDPPPGEAS